MKCGFGVSKSMRNTTSLDKLKHLVDWSKKTPVSACNKVAEPLKCTEEEQANWFTCILCLNVVNTYHTKTCSTCEGWFKFKGEYPWGSCPECRSVKESMTTDEFVALQIKKLAAKGSRPVPVPRR